MIYNETITLNMIQATKEDIYIDKLKETLEEQGIAYEIKKVIPHGAISFARPMR